MAGSSRRRALAATVATALVGTMALVGVGPADAFIAPQLLRASESPIDAAGNDDSTTIDMTPDGEKILFTSNATNILTPDLNATSNDLFVWTRSTDSVERISVTSAEVQPASGSCFDGAMSDDGNVIAFTCWFSPIVAGSDSDFRQIYVRDRTAGTTILVSRAPGAGGAVGNEDSWNPRISGDGAVVTFDSDATNLLPADTGAERDVYARVLATNGLELLSVSSAEVHAPDGAGLSAVSTTGRFVAFVSDAPAIASGDNNGAANDVFVRDRQAGTTQRVSVSTSEVGANASAGGLPDISGDGRFVVFSSASGNLDPRDPGGTSDVFLRDRTAGTTELVSVSTTGTGANGLSQHANLSADGRFVAYTSAATNQVAGDGATDDIFLRDRTRGSTYRISQTTTGIAANGVSREPMVSSNGQRIAFSSVATNLVAGAETGYQSVTWDSQRFALFADVPATFVFWDEIHWGVDNDIVKGYADDTFRPTAPVSRQAMLAFLYRIAGSPLGPFPATGFTDVPNDSPFRLPIEWAVSQGITDGYEDGTFRPTNSVTRQAAVTFLYRIADPVGPFPDSGFPDVPADSAFGIPIDWAASADIINGYSDGTFRPTVAMSRQAAVSFLYRATAST